MTTWRHVTPDLLVALHDACRHNNARDPEHGPRAAELVRELDPSLLPLSPDQLDILAHACRTHTFGMEADEPTPTIATCWDADRLDLMRVGKRPDPRFLVTEAARDPELIHWAVKRSGKPWWRPKPGA